MSRRSIRPYLDEDDRNKLNTKLIIKLPDDLKERIKNYFIELSNDKETNDFEIKREEQ